LVTNQPRDITVSENQLTSKQEKFCLEYLKGVSASDAYRAAYDCAEMKPESINREAFEVLNNPKIAARLKDLNESAVSAAVMTRQEALERLSNVARTDLADLVEFGTYEVGTEDGQPVIQATWKIKDSVLQDKTKMALISELSAGRDGIKIKTHSPLQAIQQLAKMQGWETASKHEITGKDGSPITSITTSMTPQEAAETYASTVNDN